MATTNIELAAKVSSPRALEAAAGEGADSVYIALSDFSPHSRSVNFTYRQFETALRFLHRMKRKLYVTIDKVFQQREADRVYQLLKYLAGSGADALVVQDFGVINMARDHFPALKLFASKRMNIASGRAANLLSRHGFSRVMLSPELSLKELKEIREATNMELAFAVHGELCISAHGLCLFSSFLGGKSDNRGLCTLACRRSYIVHADLDAGEKNSRQYFSPADLQLVQKLPELADAGIDSFTIEGQTKSDMYVGTAVSAYRLVIDNLGDGEEKCKQAITQACEILKADFARRKTVFLIDGIDSGGRRENKNTFDWLDPDTKAASGVPWKTGKRYAPVISGDKESKSRSPGREKAPLPKSLFSAGSKKNTAVLPAGFYVFVSQVEDLYVLQSAKPEKAILAFNKKTAAQLLENSSKPIPFPAKDIILFLDPFFPQEKEAEYALLIKALIAKGFSFFVVNNLGHFSLFRDADAGAVTLISGPWLYVFNPWAWDFLEKNNCGYCVSPLENNRQNLERSFPDRQGRRQNTRAKVFVTVFARPSLFRIRADLGKVYDFKDFTDSSGDSFRLTSG
ncbi:MAG: U32 family peptidase, partial [Treponema sp.]|nr:U32 family peptidase [Treponema sp.]